MAIPACPGRCSPGASTNSATAGVVEHHDDGSYQLTESGRDLEPVVFGLATWGARWTFGEPKASELDPDLLLWWLHRQLDTTDLPRPRFTVYVPFTDHPSRYWIVVEDEASICLADPGFEVDVTLRTDLAALYRTYLGRVSLADARRRGDVEMTGSRQAVRAFFNAFRQSPVGEIVATESRSTNTPRRTAASMTWVGDRMSVASRGQVGGYVVRGPRATIKPFALGRAFSPPIRERPVRTSARPPDDRMDP